MSILALPALPGFRRSRFRLSHHTQTFQAQGGRIVQTRPLATFRWTGEYELPPMRREEAEPWLAILSRASGSAVRFYAGDPARATPQGTGLGTPAVFGKQQTGSVLQTAGWTPTGTVTMAAGDYLSWPTSYGIELRKIAASATAAGTLLYNENGYNANGYGYGELLLSLVPAILESPVHGAALTVRNVCCPMRLLSDEGAAWDVDATAIFGIRFEAEETIEPTVGIYLRVCAATVASAAILWVNGSVRLPLAATEVPVAAWTIAIGKKHQALAAETSPVAGAGFVGAQPLVLSATQTPEATVSGETL